MVGMGIKPLEHTVTRMELVDAIVNKNRRDLRRYRDDVVALVDHISPLYRELLYRIISCNSVKFRFAWGTGSCTGDFSDAQKLFYKRVETEVHSSLNPDSFCHEFGHAVDDFYGLDQALSSTLEIEPGQTLYDIYTDEFLAHKNEIYDYVIRYYWELSEQRIGKQRTDILRRYYPLYEFLFCGRSDTTDKKPFLAARKKIHKTLDRVGFVDTYCRFYEAKVIESVEYYFSPIIDSLSSLFDIRTLRLSGHYGEYYQYGSRSVAELFANLFSVELISDRQTEAYLLRFFPHTVSAFQKLFELVYRYFVNGEKYPLPNKRFTPADQEALSARWHEGRQSALAHVSSLGDGGRPMDEESQKVFAEVKPFFAPDVGPEYDYLAREKKMLEEIAAIVEGVEEDAKEVAEKEGDRDLTK